MKILHTSDWHLGHRLREHSQYYEQEKFLQWLIDFIRKEDIDVLLVSGDVYDTGYPSTQSQDLFYGFLAKLHSDTNCKKVIMTAGNHDAPGTLNAPDHFMRNFNIRLVGKASENPEDEILKFDIKDEKLTVAAVPFLRDRDIRRAIAGEDAIEIENRYKIALKKHYDDIADIIKNDNDTFKIAMGHLFAVDGQTSESENRIYVGGLGDISAEDFPTLFDYIALGHLHRPQKVGGKEHIRYSGSPYPLSFDEAKSKKKVILIKTTNNKLTSIDEIEIPVFRKLYTIKGSLENSIKQIEDIAKQKHETEPWIEVTLDEEGTTSNDYLRIYDAIKALNVKVLNVKREGYTQVADITDILEEDKQLKELKPEDIFKRKCEEENFDLNKNKEILDAFYEVLNDIGTG